MAFGMFGMPFNMQCSSYIDAMMPATPPLYSYGISAPRMGVLSRDTISFTGNTRRKQSFWEKAGATLLAVTGAAVLLGVLNKFKGQLNLSGQSSQVLPSVQQSQVAPPVQPTQVDPPVQLDQDSQKDKLDDESVDELESPETPSDDAKVNNDTPEDELTDEDLLSEKTIPINKDESADESKAPETPSDGAKVNNDTPEDESKAPETPSDGAKVNNDTPEDELKAPETPSDGAKVNNDTPEDELTDEDLLSEKTIPINNDTPADELKAPETPSDGAKVNNDTPEDESKAPETPSDGAEVKGVDDESSINKLPQPEKTDVDIVTGGTVEHKADAPIISSSGGVVESFVPHPVLTDDMIPFVNNPDGPVAKQLDMTKLAAIRPRDIDVIQYNPPTNIPEYIDPTEMKDSTDAQGRMKTELSGDYYCIYEYDNDSEKPTREFIYKEDGKFCFYRDYIYDKEGNEMNLAYNPTDKTPFSVLTSTKLRNSEGREVMNFKYDSQGKVSYTTYEYDSSGNIVRQANYDAEGKLLEYETEEYDSNNNRLKSKCYNSDGQYTGRYYDFEKGLWGQEDVQ